MPQEISGEFPGGDIINGGVARYIIRGGQDDFPAFAERRGDNEEKQSENTDDTAHETSREVMFFKVMGRIRQRGSM
jgi:hypothetical protein